MGFAAAGVLTLVALAIAGFILYGVFLGLVRLARLPGQAYRWFWNTDLLDVHSEAARTRDQDTCWDTKHCPPEVRDRCPAYRHRDEPCWLAVLRESGKLRTDCLGCRHFSLVEYIGSR